ncbi:DUF6457 domain-containing protein [Egicoccus halophilus]|uniref:DUF6457 domain-containing protein n=1 Tax=Egicoccus halophilus TaxID=1670830 RepID=A0A8J3A700_9ACTN|nr:DUF6457 domain-containing protein [Egicoccus halophilus]GGI05186.1 hypothetical protein GCM10011354_12840 [Egicoccus halophilus]
MQPESWFVQLTAALSGEAPVVTADERAALLDLARIAAHTSERWTAPLSTFVAGVALADLPADERARRLRALVDDLDDPDDSAAG